jgi:segregation and condensation protein B
MRPPFSTIQQQIEALIFCATTPITAEDIANVLAEMYDTPMTVADIAVLLEVVHDKYKTDDFPFQVVQSGGGYQFLTKAVYQDTINVLLKQKSKKRLSNSAMETLAIIAYKQPITKAHIEQLRGVNVDYAIQKLLEKELIEMRGKAETVGKPLLYGTTEKFLDYFGINSLTELPMPKDLAEKNTNQIGEE